MNIEEFLYIRDTDLATVVSEVEAKCGFGSNDILIAVGSLTEDLGNSKSDLDLLFITPEGEKLLGLEDTIAIIVGKCLVDIRVLSQTEINNLIARLEAWAKLQWNVTHAVKFTLEERTLLHRLISGRILYEGKSNQFIERMPAKFDLARLKLHVARHMSRTIQVDMVGYRENNDYRSLSFAAQEILGHATDALLAGYQLTNPLTKWRSRLLDLLPSDWNRSIMIRPSTLAAVEYVWQLHRIPERPERLEVLEHSFQITTFARAVFAWAESKLNNGFPMTRQKKSRSNIDSERDVTLPYLDFDVDFYLAENQVFMSRLNEFNEMLTLSPHEFAFILLFDGVMNLSAASSIIYGSSDDEDVLRHCERLISQINDSGLSFSLKPEPVSI